MKKYLYILSKIGVVICIIGIWTGGIIKKTGAVIFGITVIGYLYNSLYIYYNRHFQKQKLNNNNSQNDAR